MADFSQQITDAASAPKDATSGTKRVTQHDLADLIAADQYVRETTGGSRTSLPIRIMKIKPGGTV